MKVFLTFNDNPSGIYKSQVIKVIETLNTFEDNNFLLIAFIPRQHFSSNKNRIKSWYSNTKVYPIFPGIRFWKYSRFLYKILNTKLKPATIIARGPLAAHFALASKIDGQKVVYDGRGAIKAEQDEFQVYAGKLAGQIGEMEATAVRASDFRISVSNALVEYWQRTYNYQHSNHIVIPCLADSTDEYAIIEDDFFQSGSPILVYSGSTSPWQSFPLLVDKVTTWLKNTDGKVLFLTRNHELISDLLEKYPARVKCKFVAPEAVSSYLSKCDYGLLIRETNVTNEVASPVKYGEYLSCGLAVIITDNILDYAKFTAEQSVGHVINQDDEIPTNLSKNSLEEREKTQQIYKTQLSKKSFVAAYEKVASI